MPNLLETLQRIQAYGTSEGACKAVKTKGHQTRKGCGGSEEVDEERGLDDEGDSGVLSDWKGTTPKQARAWLKEDAKQTIYDDYGEENADVVIEYLEKLARSGSRRKRRV